MHYFFFREEINFSLFFLSFIIFSFHHSFTFNLCFLYELKHIIYPKLCLEFSIFHSVSLNTIKIYIFVQQKIWTLWIWNVIIPFKIKKTRKDTHSFTLRRLIFKFQQGVWKFSNICVNWSWPDLTWRQKTDIETMF